MTHATLEAITKRIRERSVESRQRYLDAMKRIGEGSPQRNVLSCGNLAHGFAACGAEDKDKLKGATPNIGIVTAYNDMLSAHNPYYDYPEKLKAYARGAGAVAQVAGGVPAMCDGVTQGQLGMELSLFSRDTIALGAAVTVLFVFQLFSSTESLSLGESTVAVARQASETVTDLLTDIKSPWTRYPDNCHTRLSGCTGHGTNCIGAVHQ